jgi:hypothetical protein
VQAKPNALDIVVLASRFVLEHSPVHAPEHDEFAAQSIWHGKCSFNCFLYFFARASSF